jgi:glutamate dehydrogenase
VTTTPEIIEFLEGPNDLIVTKANVKSVIHRRAYMDYIGIKLFNKAGNVAGELRVVGLFTSTAYTQSVTSIPLLRSKIATVAQHFGYDTESHSGKALLNTLEAYPRDDLFQISPELLTGFCEQIVELVERPRIRVLPRIDHFDRFVSLMVYVPREQYDSAVRERISNYLIEAYEGRLSAYYPAFPEGGVARVHFIIGRSEGKTPNIPQAELEEKILEIATSWEERFATLSRSRNLTLKAGRDFQAAFEPAEAYGDINRVLEAATRGISIKFYMTNDDLPKLGLKIFHAEIPFPSHAGCRCWKIWAFASFPSEHLTLPLGTTVSSNPLSCMTWNLTLPTEKRLTSKAKRPDWKRLSWPRSPGFATMTDLTGWFIQLSSMSARLPFCAPMRAICARPASPIRKTILPQR